MLSRREVLHVVDGDLVEGTLMAALQFASYQLEEWLETGNPIPLEFFLSGNEVVIQALDELGYRHYITTGVDYGRSEKNVW